MERGFLPILFLHLFWDALQGLMFKFRAFGGRTFAGFGRVDKLRLV